MPGGRHAPPFARSDRWPQPRSRLAEGRSIVPGPRAHYEGTLTCAAGTLRPWLA